MESYLDADHWKVSQLIDELNASASELRALQIIAHLKPELSKDGNQFCYLLGENPQEGISGFGDTVCQAMNNFCNNFWTEKITIQNG